MKKVPQNYSRLT